VTGAGLSGSWFRRARTSAGSSGGRLNSSKVKSPSKNRVRALQGRRGAGDSVVKYGPNRGW
jgi:hypothetical protein